MSWDDTRIALLRKLHAEGLSFSEITYEINRETRSTFSRNATIGKASRLGIVAQAPRPKGTIGPRYERKPKGVTTSSGIVDTPKAKRGRTKTGQLNPDFGVLERFDAQLRPDYFLGIPFLELNPSHCRYPHGDGAAMLFCGQPQQNDSSYCASCHRRCHFRPHANYIVSDAERERRSLRFRQMNARRRAA